MLRRVLVISAWTCALALTFALTSPKPANSQTVASSGNCPYWVNVANGRTIRSYPAGMPIDKKTSADLNGEVEFTLPGGQRVAAVKSGGQWINVANGQTIRSYPAGMPIDKKTSADLNGEVEFTLPGGQRVTAVLVPCPPPKTAVEVSMSLGVVNTATSFVSTGFFSAGTPDAVTDNKQRASGTGFIGGIGASAALGALTNPFAAETGVTMHYADDPKEAYAASFPIKAPPKPQPPRWLWGIDGNVYFFAGGSATINGIPGGPFGTAAGADSFNIRNNVMFMLGAFVTAPLTPSWALSVTGGFAELNQTVKYNCVTFCGLAGTLAFTASQDRWVPGGYLGARLSTPITLPGIGPANIGIDYKHVFFGNTNVSLGTVPTVQVNARLSPDMDLVTVRLGVPIR